MPPNALIAAALASVCFGFCVAALVGLPLYADGGHYFFRIIVDGAPWIPQNRVAAALPQLPALFASWVIDDLTLVRHIFSFAYVLLPAGSLVACWWVVRRRMPLLMLFPALSMLLTQANFSSVSELLATQYLVWPLLLGMVLMPERRSVQRYALVTAPLLVVLHPLAALPAFGLALLAAMIAVHPASALNSPFAAAGDISPGGPAGRARQRLRSTWLKLAFWLTAAGTLRVVWSVSGLSPYESWLLDHGFAWYFFALSHTQHLLLVAVLLIAGYSTARSLRGPGGRAGRGSRLLPWLALLALPVLVAMLATEFLWGEGIRLKSGIHFAGTLLLMVCGASVGLLAHRSGQGQAPPESEADTGDAAASDTTRAMRGSLTLPVVIALLGITALVLVKSACWWTAIRGLQDMLSTSTETCIVHGQSEPFSLQWPWMSIIDEWNAPMNALAFRPRLSLSADGGVLPVPLLLPDNGCEWLELTGEAHLVSWLKRPWRQLDRHYGPLKQVVPAPENADVSPRQYGNVP